MKGRLVGGAAKNIVKKSLLISENMAEEESDSNENSPIEIAVSKNYFDLEKIGPIDSDVPVVDELQSFIEAVMDCIRNGKKQTFNDTFGQILQFYASMAYEANYVMGETKAADHALVMTATYQELVQNLHLKEGYRDVFFSKWPDGVLPEEYLTWVDQKYENGKGGKEAALNEWVVREAPKHVSASKETKLKLYFGSTLINLAQEAFRVIRKYHNRYYVQPEDLGSGKNMTAMFKAMKRRIIVNELFEEH